MFDATTYEIILKEMLKDKNYSTGAQMFSTERHFSLLWRISIYAVIFQICKCYILGFFIHKIPASH